MGVIVPLPDEPPPAESTDDKLERVLAKLDRIERVVGVLILHLPMRWRLAVQAVWNG